MELAVVRVGRESLSENCHDHLVSHLVSRFPSGNLHQGFFSDILVHFHPFSDWNYAHYTLASASLKSEAVDPFKPNVMFYLNAICYHLKKNKKIKTNLRSFVEQTICWIFLMMFLLESFFSVDLRKQIGTRLDAAAKKWKINVRKK